MPRKGGRVVCFALFLVEDFDQEPPSGVLKVFGPPLPVFLSLSVSVYIVYVCMKYEIMFCVWCIMFCASCSIFDVSSFMHHTLCFVFCIFLVMCYVLCIRACFLIYFLSVFPSFSGVGQLEHTYSY